MKKILASLLALVLVFCAIACTKSSDAKTEIVNTAAPAAASESDTNDDPSDPVSVPGTLVGGWSVAESAEITDEIRALLNQATEGMVGASLVPVAYLGSQVVAGRNHCLLCTSTPVVPNPVSHYVLVFLYEALDGSVTLSNIADLDIGALRSGQAAGEQPETSGELVPGGWGTAPDEILSAEAKAIFEKATAVLLGVSYTPIAHLGSQVVAGINRCYLARSTVVTPNAVPTYSLVYVFEDLQGNAEILDVVQFDLGSFMEYGA